MPPPVIEVEHVDWLEHRARFRWEQGDHVSLIGPTHTGKTNAAVQLLDLRTYVCAIGTKPKDKTLEHLRTAHGYREVVELPERGRPPRVIVWPRPKSINRESKRAMAKIIRKAMDDAYSAGAWCVFIDELHYVSSTLRLSDELVDLWRQGRAMGVSVAGCTQRPRHVPLDCYSQASHLYLWRTNDRDDLRRLSALNASEADPRVVAQLVANLPRFHLLYVDTRTGAMWTTVAPKL